MRAQERSLEYHTTRARDAPGELSVVDVERAVLEVRARVPTVDPDSRFWEEDGTLKSFSEEWDGEFRELMERKTWADTSPGHPFKGVGVKTSGEAIEKELLLGNMVYSRLRTRIEVMKSFGSADFGIPWKSSGGQEPITGETLLKWNFRDVVRLFIKSEPHTLSKAALDRWRLIMNTSLIDIGVSRVVGQAAIDAALSAWDEPSSMCMPGMGLDSASIGKLRRAMDTIKQTIELETGEKLEWQSADAKHWDWSVTLLLLLAAAEVTRQMYDVELDSDLAMALRAEAIAIAYKTYVTGSGELWMDQDPGKQESGSLWTAFWNSIMRCLLSAARGSLYCKAMGDDSTELWRKNQPAHKVDGFKIEYPELPADVEFEFCSHWFMRDGRVIPLNWGKTLFRLLAHKPDPLMRHQFIGDLKDLPEKEAVVAWLDAHWVC